MFPKRRCTNGQVSPACADLTRGDKIVDGMSSISWCFCRLQHLKDEQGELVGECRYRREKIPLTFQREQSSLEFRDFSIDPVAFFGVFDGIDRA